jgi:hypothetical protein
MDNFPQCADNNPYEFDCTMIVRNYGIPAEYIDDTYLDFIRYRTDQLCMLDGCSHRKITLVMASMILAYHLPVRKNPSAVSIGGYRRALDEKLTEFCHILSEQPLVDAAMYSRSVFYFNRAYLRFMRKFDRHLADYLESISHVDPTVALCLREVVGRDLLELVVIYTMIIRNTNYRRALI